MQLISSALHQITPHLRREVSSVNGVLMFQAVAAAWRELHKGFLDTYRPELHYMRGPGPKWREQHGAPQTTRSRAVVRALRGTRSMDADDAAA